MDNNEIRVLIAKPGLDGHDRGAKVITRYLSEQNIKTKFFMANLLMVKVYAMKALLLSFGKALKKYMNSRKLNY